MNRKQITRSAGLLLALLASAVAQTVTEGTIRGVLRDEQGAPMPGVTVSAASPNAPGNHVSITEGDGQYRLLNLRPGIYELSAEQAGFSKSVQAGVEVRAGLNLTVDIQLRVGAVTETVTVTGEAPLLETEKPIQSVNVAGDFQRDLPLSTRHDLTDALEVTPGVAARTFISNNGTQVYMLRGTDVEQHVVLIDGADMGSSRQGRTDFVNFSSATIADSQVKTGGADAAAPIGLGVVLNVATKSGTNQLHGTAGFSYQRRSWNANNDPKGVPTIADGMEPEAAIGGPIRKDKAFFFASYRYLYRNSQISRSETQLTNLRAVQPGWQPFDNRSRTGAMFIKGTVQLSDKHQLSGFFLRESGHEEGNQSTNIKPLSAGGISGIGVSGRIYSAWTNTLTSSVGVSYNNIAANASLSAFDGLDYGGPSLLLYNSFNTSAGRLVGNGLLVTTGNNTNFGVTPSDKVTIQGDVNWFRTGFAGSHEIQSGGFFQPRLHLQTDQNYLNSGFILEEAALRVSGDLTSGYVPFHRQYVDKSQLALTTARSNSKNYAGYIQDSWKPVRGLAIIGGFRVDNVVAIDEQFHVQTQSSVELQPRIGVTYTLTKDGRNIVHATFSRIAAKPEPAFLPSLGGSVTVTLTDLYDPLRNGSFSTSLITPAQSQVAANRRIDPDRHQEHTDEFLAGFRRQLPGRISVDATFVRRYYRDMPAQINVNAIYQNVEFVGYIDVTQNAILLQTNNKWNTPVYTGWEFVGSQRTSKSQFIFGYTRTLQHLDGTWQPDDPAAFLQPGAFADDRGIGTIRGNENNSLSGTAETRNPMWIKHTLRLAGSYNAPWGIKLSSNLNILSGPYTGPIVKYLSAPDPQFGPATLTLSNGRVVSNPLATTVRFAYANRGEGQLQSPTLATWNGRVARSFSLGESRKFEVAFSVVNMTNRGTEQEFLGGSTTTASTGSNQIGSPNFAYGPDGIFRGQNRQAARAGQLTVRFEF